MEYAKLYKEPSRWRRYSLAVAAVAGAVLIHVPFHPLLAGRLSFLLFALAVMLSGWYGGLDSGLLSTGLSIVAWGLLLLEPTHWLRLRYATDYVRRDIAQLVLFVPVAVGVSLLAESLHRDHRRLRAAAVAKDHFLATLSHELRTPLAPAVLVLSASQDRPDLPAGLREDLALAQSSIEIETRLIEDLLDVTRISQGKLILKRQVADAHDCMRRAVEVCRSALEAKGLQLEVDLGAPASGVDGDPVRLQQVFWNLLTNAIKFTPKGGTIGIRSYNTAAENANGAANALAVEVRDSGIGIEPEEQRRIFAPFQQADRSIARRFGGLGLGLAICRSLVELHGGTISVSSAGRNQGSVFTVVLPSVALPAVTSSHPVRAPQAVRPRVPADNHNLRILLVEDSADTRRILSRLLSGVGYQVRAAASVGEGLAAARAEPFDLLVSDLGLPDGSGYDLMRQIKQSYGLKGIAMSGYGMDEDIAASKAAGFSEHLTKPVDLHRLNEAIAHVVREASLGSASR